MAHGRVARQRLHIVDRPVRRPLHHRPLHTAMLVPQRNLQMKDLLPVALEPEMAWLNDPGMHRPHGHLMDLLAFNLIELDHTDLGQRRLRASPRIMSWPARLHKPHGLQPGMPLGHKPELLGNLALEQMDLRTIRRQGRKRFARHPGPRHPELALFTKRQHGIEINALPAFRLMPEERRHPGAILHGIQDGRPETHSFQHRHIAPGHRGAVTQNSPSQDRGHRTTSR